MKPKSPKPPKPKRPKKPLTPRQRLGYLKAAMTRARKARAKARRKLRPNF